VKSALPWIAVVLGVFSLLTLELPRQGPNPEEGSPAGLHEVEARVIRLECTDSPRCANDYLGLVDKMTDGTRAGRGWLFDGSETRSAIFAEIDNVPEGGIQQIRMVFEDDYVGIFEALLHIPSGHPPWKAAIAVPGRNQTAADYPGRLAIAEAGTLLLVLQPRGSDGGATEARLRVELAPVELTLADLRDYEVALLRRYLRFRGDILRSPIELLPSGDPPPEPQPPLPAPTAEETAPPSAAG
jgi:hypothetical protein